MVFAKFFKRKKEPRLRLARTRGYNQDVVGEAHYQTALARECGGKDEFGVKHKVDVIVSSTYPNSHDKDAVTLLIGKSIVGFIPKSDTFAIREEIHAIDPSMPDLVASGKIVGGWQNDRGEGHFGLKLNMKRPLALKTD